MKIDSISKAVNMESIAIFGSKLFHPSLNKLSFSLLTPLPTEVPKFRVLKATSTLSSNDEVSNRTFKKMEPSPWTDRFHSYFIDVSEMDAVRKEIDGLKTKVKNTLMAYQGDIDSTKKRILMIYLLKSLGLAYHFDEEIYETLEEDFEKIEDMMAGEEDLYVVSIIFWVFRSYGHNISSDVFKRFKGIDNNFKESLKGDAQAILSLYEAAHLRTRTDYILDEALTFTTRHLKLLLVCGTCPPDLLICIRNALTLPQRWNMEMIVAVEYMSSYELKKDHDEMLLKFAKLSFKLVQLQYLQDLKILTKWYKEHDLASNLPPYFRDRIVENNFLVQAVFFEPHVSRERIMCTKVFTLLITLDDTFDRYASILEADSLTNSIKRWALDEAMDQHPDFLKFVFNFVLDTFKEFERELKPEGTSDNVKATIEEFKTYVKAAFDLEKWAQANHVPSFEEYMEVGEEEITLYISMAGIFMCLGKICTKETYEWLKSRPKLFKSLATKGRLMNDIAGLEDDMSRGYVTNSVNCYMKKYGVTKQEAVTKLNIMVADADKMINQELLTANGVSRLVLKASLGLAQVIAICYNGYEGYTYPEGKIKEYMTSLFVDHIRL